MAWGWMMGLGQGLQQVGQEWSAAKRKELADKLQDERESAREERRQQRELQEVKKEGLEMNPNGLWTYVQRNKNGGLLSERPTTQAEQDAIKLKEQTDKLSLENLTSQTTYNKWKADNAPAAFALEEEETRARIASNEASASAARALANQRDSTVTTTPSITEATNQLIADYKDLADQYFTKDKEGNFTGTMTPEEFRRNAELSVLQAKAEGKDAGVIFRRRLEAFNAERRKNKPTNAASGNSAFSLDSDN